eukprot:7385737-Prymnesium_polylepis.3
MTDTWSRWQCGCAAAAAGPRERQALHVAGRGGCVPCPRAPAPLAISICALCSIAFAMIRVVRGHVFGAVFGRPAVCWSCVCRVEREAQ